MITYLRIRNFNITPPAINEMPLRHNTHLGFMIRKPDETETFRLSSFWVFFNLQKMQPKINLLFFTKDKNYKITLHLLFKINK